MLVMTVKKIATTCGFDRQLDSFERSGCGGEVMKRYEKDDAKLHLGTDWVSSMNLAPCLVALDFGIPNKLGSFAPEFLTAWTQGIQELVSIGRFHISSPSQNN